MSHRDSRIAEIPHDTPQVINGNFTQKLTFTRAKLYAITVTATDAAGNSSSIIRNVIYRSGARDSNHNDD